jgi:hypothetical protein
MENAFRNIQILSQVRSVVKNRLGANYPEIINSVIHQIERFKELNNVNHFEAVKMIQETTTLMDNEIKVSIFSVRWLCLVANKIRLNL